MNGMEVFLYIVLLEVFLMGIGAIILYRIFSFHRWILLPVWIFIVMGVGIGIYGLFAGGWEGIAWVFLGGVLCMTAVAALPLIWFAAKRYHSLKR